MDGSPGSRRRSDFAGGDCLKIRLSPIPPMGADAPQVGGESTRLSHRATAVCHSPDTTGCPLSGGFVAPACTASFRAKPTQSTFDDFERSTRAESRAVVSAPRWRRQCRSLARFLSISRDTLGDRDHWTKRGRDCGAHRRAGPLYLSPMEAIGRQKSPIDWHTKR